jgi:hypothetical protein
MPTKLTPQPCIGGQPLSCRVFYFESSVVFIENPAKCRNVVFSKVSLRFAS